MPLELTERELALARGDDPDEFAAGVYDDEPEREDPDENPETDAADGEPDSDDLDSSEDDSGGDDPEPDDWVSEDLAELGASYGLTAESMRRSFADAGDFRRKARDYDLSLSQRRSQMEQQSGRQPGQGGSAVNSGTGKTGPDTAADSRDKEIPLDPEWYRERDYDDATLALVARVKAQQEQLDRINPFLQEIHQQRVQEFRQREEQAFHDAMDQLNAERYGRARDDAGQVKALDEFSLENRRRLFHAAKSIEHDLAMVARSQGVVPQSLPPSVLLRRAELLVFGDQIEQELAARAEQSRVAAEEQRVQAAAQQAKRRRPVSGTTRPRVTRSRPAADDLDDVSRIANSPELVKFWNQAQDENG